MTRMWFACVFVTALLSVSVFAGTQAQPPAQFEAIEHYVALVNEGAKAPLRAMFTGGMLHAEHALYWSEERGTAALPRLYALIDAGARLEVEFHAAAAAGGVIITTERMWVDDAPEALTPLRATSVYVLDGDRILGITRVLDPDQRHELMREALVGTWELFVEPTRIEHDAAGVFRYGPLTGASEHDVIDSGSSAVQGDLWTIVRDDATQVCDPGDVTVFQVRFVTPDAIALTVVEDSCRGWVGAGSHRFDRVVD